jgi:cytochrome d ubiquinol oxidase subunit I
MDTLLLHRIHFALTISYHYLFPQLTMGVALLIVVLKAIAIRRKDERYNEARITIEKALSGPRHSAR